MKLFLPSLFLCFITGFAVAAQRPGGSSSAKARSTVVKVPAKIMEVKDPPITDTFAFNIQKTIDKLSLFILDPDKPVDLLMASFAGTPSLGQPEYHSTISFPGAVDNLLTRIHVYRDEKKTMWQWHAVLINVPRGQMSKQELTDLTNRINMIVKNIHYTATDEKNKIDEIKGYDNTEWTFNKEDIAEFKVTFTKPAAIQTDEQTIDSVRKLYVPGFASIETAQNAATKFGEALLAEGFSEEKVEAIAAPEIRKAADRDIKTAFQMLTGMPFGLKAAALTAKLSDDQRQQIRTMAQASVDAYNQQRPFDIKTFNPNPPPPPVYTTYSNNAGSYSTPTTANLYSKKEPEGQKVRCGVCSGTGEMDVLDYSHTYTGIYSNITTQTTHKTRCTFCGGSGWVIKYKKR